MRKQVMTQTAIQQLFRAVVFIDCPWDSHDPRAFARNCDAAHAKMHAIETEAAVLARNAGVEFESLNTQALWQAALQLESHDESKVREAVTAIEALVARTAGARIHAD